MTRAIVAMMLPLMAGATLFAQTFAIPRAIVANGGGEISAGPYAVSATIAEPAAGGPLTNGSVSIIGGFLAGDECPAIQVTATPLPSGILGLAYTRVALAETGGNGVATFAVTGGALPAGLILSIVGIVSGTPTQSGDFAFTVTATDASGCSASTGFTISILLPPPVMSLDKRTLIFGATTGATGFGARTSTQAVQLTQSGTGVVRWTATSNQPWLVVSPATGTGPATLYVSVQDSGGLTGAPAGSIVLALSGAGNNPGPINVRLNLIPDGASDGPFGYFDTPQDRAGNVVGSIAVTGWALDDIEVTRVRIMRDPVPGEDPASQVFIGNAALVDGARPDVQALYPTSPHNTRAGWGYMLLTNLLPALGNGTFTLYAIADDAERHSTVLGSKTITCTNSSSTTPFGAIDTPGPGDIISGVAYVNFGWVLSRAPRRADPLGGGSVTVLIDGVAVGSPFGWVARPDITSFFPLAQYSGANNAVGAFVLDTTTLSNGVHTIAWVVTDSGGGTSAVGSRFFTVVNNTATLLDSSLGGTFRTPAGSIVVSGPVAPRIPQAAVARGFSSVAALDSIFEAVPRATGAIQARVGVDPALSFNDIQATDGVATVDARPLDAIDLRLELGPAGEYSGYLRTPSGLAALPVGSRLDSQTGEFTWQPGVAFLGSYDFVFIRWSDGHPEARRDVRIVLWP